MKLLISESQHNSLLNELITTKHFIKRYNERFFDVDFLNVILVHNKSGNYQKIGTLVIPQDIVDEVEQNKKFITNPNLNLNNQIVFGVNIYKFNMFKLWDQIKFEPNAFIKNILKKLISKEFHLEVQDPNTKTHGIYIVVFLKGNIILTFYYSNTFDENEIKRRIKNHFPKNESIIVKNPEDINFYDEDINLNNF